MPAGTRRGPPAQVGHASAAPKSLGRDALPLAALIAAAAALRWVAWQRTAVLFDDGPRFLAIARALDAGWWSAALRDSFHPLYPALTALAHRVAGLADGAPAWEAAGAAVSTLGGAAAVGFGFAFLRDAFGRGPAWAGAVLLAVHARGVEYASDVQSDGLYLGLFAAGLWAGFRGWRSGSAGLAAMAGAASGLAYLTRPEGAGLALLLGALGLASLATRRWTLRTGAAWLAALGTATVLCMAPYVWALHELTGVWTLTYKKSMTALVGREATPTPGAPAPPAAPATPPGAAAAPAAPAIPPAPLQPVPPPWLDALGLSAPQSASPDELAPAHLEQDGLRIALAPSAGARAREALRMLGRHARSALGYGVFALVVVGLVAARGRPGSRAAFAWGSVALYGLVLYALALSAGYVSRRHALPPLLPLFGYAGLGALALGTVAARAAGRPGRGALAGALVVAAFALGEASRHLAPKRLDELAGRRAAEWLRDHAPEPGSVAGSRQRLGYYAERPFVPLAGIADDALGRYLSRTGVRYVLVEDRDQLAALERAEGDAVRVLHEVEAAGERAWVLERRLASAAPEP